MLIRKRPIYITSDTRLNIKYKEVLCYTRKKIYPNEAKMLMKIIIKKVKVFPNQDLIKKEKQIVKIRITSVKPNYYNGDII